MKILMTTLLLLLLLVGTAAMASGGHSHDADGGHSLAPMSADDAINRALKKVKQLVNVEKIAATWADVKTATAKQKSYVNGPEWVIALTNNKVVDTTKQTLYLFFSLDGHYIAANYSGE